MEQQVWVCFALVSVILLSAVVSWRNIDSDACGKASSLLGDGKLGRASPKEHMGGAEGSFFPVYWDDFFLGSFQVVFCLDSIYLF